MVTWTTPFADRHSQLTQVHRTAVKCCFNRTELAKNGNVVARPELTGRLAIACGISPIESFMGMQAKLATAASKLGGNHWSNHRFQIVQAGMDPDSTSCARDAHAVRQQTKGGDTLF